MFVSAMNSSVYQSNIRLMTTKVGAESFCLKYTTYPSEKVIPNTIGYLVILAVFFHVT